jgi:hypothetical protein
MGRTLADATREYRSALLERAESLQQMAENAAQRAAWIERCGGDRADIAWLRQRSDRLHDQTLALVQEFDDMCRKQPAVVDAHDPRVA